MDADESWRCRQAQEGPSRREWKGERRQGQGRSGERVQAPRKQKGEDGAKAVGAAQGRGAEERNASSGEEGGGQTARPA
jgi:hypothetical protein